MLTDVRFTTEHQPSVVQSSAKGLLQGASNPDLSDSGGHALDLCSGRPHPVGTIPLLPCLRTPTEAYHFPRRMKKEPASVFWNILEVTSVRRPRGLSRARMSRLERMR